ncbi:efflux RND transporter periplasmic adaptor subunit [Methylocystis sp. Sn-Cys]|uniref:efflux RND transporter periplasmic adaptor subunit n=1 Tax=Methylocystis sp. Sn-Cys TaxID=1701263 RepID=UPI0019230036|nr:efflux RND transporter periplasmic adaptor subunit [Methylocystis sp. Sn-Cys]MBL1257769.1 efflux RND transporter periplasmic adaptor subunit [Methylocystis sp. Sn-Cys]
MEARNFIGLTLIAAGALLQARPAPLAAETSPPNSAAPQTVMGVGALGRIEPMSRVIRVSPDQGVAGTVISEIRVREGQEVAKGDVIAVFSDYERRQAEVDLAEAEFAVSTAHLTAADAQFKKAQRDYDRKNSLRLSGTVSAFAFDEAELRSSKAKADLEATRASLKQSEANLRLKKLQLLQAQTMAPIDGTILKIRARAGERVGDKGILDMADLSSLDVVAEVYESDIARVKAGQTAVVRVPPSEAAYEAKVRTLGFTVEKNLVNSSDPLVDHDARVVEVRLTLSDPARKDFQHQIYRQVQVHIAP